MPDMTMFDRRTIIGAGGAAALIPARLAAKDSAAFSFAGLTARARRLARAPFAETPPHPRAAAIGYDDGNQARFRDDRTIWGDLPGATGIRLFPLSSTAPQPVQIALIENGRERVIAYDPSYFDLPAGNAVGKLGEGAGFAGFRAMNAQRNGDWLSFLGASYFRAPGPQRQFGLSARAVAVNTSIEGREEFPRFTHFWIERTSETGVRVYALLDGASLTGAYRFDNVLTPDGVRQQVSAALFMRRPVEELGLMPMTSMFWYDQTRQRGGDADWRPEVHDSDLLAMLARDGTHHVRPLVNPARPHLSRFGPLQPAAFGLLQRDRDFTHYQDDGVFYDRRPSLRATIAAAPDSEVRLWEFPTVNEYVDNIGAYVTPRRAPRAGERIDLAYRLDWDAARTLPGPTVTMLDNIWRGAADEAGAERIVLDFSGLTVGDKPELWTDLVGGTLLRSAAYAVQGRDGLYRVTLDIRNDKPADLRVQLRSGGRGISEYVHYPLGI